MKKLKKEHIVPALEANHGTLLFRDGDVGSHSFCRITKQGEDLIFACTYMPNGIKSLDEIFKHVSSLSPYCSWCPDVAINFQIMPDGYLVCDGCAKKVKEYYKCSVCEDILQPALGAFARKKFERIVCEKQSCKKTDDIKYGRICCKEAKYINCVCARAYKCPVHAPQGVHSGSHE